MHEGHHDILDGTKKEIGKHHHHKKTNINQIVSIIIVAALVVGFVVWKFM